MTTLINSHEYTKATHLLRSFFISKGFIEVHTQNRLSIMAACEDPTTLATYTYAGKIWPLPQTGQMWLEYELLSNPDVPGFFCVSTSYREEPNPIPGRHEIIFPMFEFEFPGDVSDLEQMELDLCEYAGFGTKDSFIAKDYSEWAKEYDTKELESEHELQMYEDHGGVALIKNFPNYTSPFWNMKQNADKQTAAKIDVILAGQETIGSAERSCDPEEMRHQFDTISDGSYAGLLYEKFGKDRVEKEFEEFLALPFFPRCGGGIGVTRFIRAMQLLTPQAMLQDKVKETVTA